MPKYYGVECKGCQTPIALGTCDENKSTVAFYAAPLDAVLCNECGGSFLYGSDDLFAFEGADNTPKSGQV
jgi:hypothetical protein